MNNINNEGIYDARVLGRPRMIVLGLQHMFAMFGATILVPLLTGLDIGVSLIASGMGTLIYIFTTRGKVPMYLGSSFAYIAAITGTVAITATALMGGVAVGSVLEAKQLIADGILTYAEVYSPIYTGLLIVGLIYTAIALIIRFTGSSWLKKLLPPIVVGPIIIIIGLSLAPTAVDNIGLNGGSGWQVPVVALITFSTAVLVGIKGKGFLKVIPFLIAILVGYVASMVVGLVPVEFALGFIPYPNVFGGSAFIKWPEFTFIGTYSFNWTALSIFVPIAFVTIAEHIGDHVVLGEICDADFITDPGLDKTLLGGGIATFASAAIGGPANTSYGENTGVIAMSGVGSVWVIGLAAVFAVILGFFGYIQAIISSIPWAVIGGMTIILYGLIASNGIKILIKDKPDLANMKNVIIMSTMLVLGLGGASLVFGTFNFSGMSLAATVGIILNLILPDDKNKDTVKL